MSEPIPLREVGDWEDDPEWTEKDLEIVYLWLAWCVDRIQPALGGETNCGISLPRDSSE